jgi:hypothetical protein
MSDARLLEIDLKRQRLFYYEHGRFVREYWVSTARNGPGEIMNSECTPRGWHAIANKIGDGAPPGAVFVARQWTGEVWSPEFAATQPVGRDWILTRILWLTGLEPGHNAGGDRDTHARYIYLHGTPDTVPLGVAGSRGCVRMRNADLITLFDRMAEGDRVFIYD